LDNRSSGFKNLIFIIELSKPIVSIKILVLEYIFFVFVFFFQKENNNFFSLFFLRDQINLQSDLKRFKRNM
jgi:hypothetical protein